MLLTDRLSQQVKLCLISEYINILSHQVALILVPSLHYLAIFAVLPCLPLLVKNCLSWMECADHLSKSERC